MKCRKKNCLVSLVIVQQQIKCSHLDLTYRPLQVVLHPLPENDNCVSIVLSDIKTKISNTNCRTLNVLWLGGAAAGSQRLVNFLLLEVLCRVYFDFSSFS